MTHELTQTIPDLKTKMKTSVDSYFFTCPVCKEKRRYGYSFDNKEEVFCNGDDFGTKMVVEGVIMEIADALYIKDKFSKEDEVIEDTGKESLDEMEVIVQEDEGIKLTKKGFNILTELKK